MIVKNIISYGSKRHKGYLKGVGTTVASIIVIVLLLFFLAVYLSTINNEANKRVTINLRESTTLKMANTFDIVNRSLGMTWYISSVQSLFKSTENVFFCGIDDIDQETANQEWLPDKYVYRYDGRGVKNERSVFNSLFFSDTPSNIGEATIGKYNIGTDWPRVCFETKLDAKNILEEQFEPYKKVKSSFDVNGLKIKIDNIENEFGFNVGVWSKTKQGLTIQSSSTLQAINEFNTQNVNQFFTEVPKMIAVMNNIPRYLALLSDNFYLSTDEQEKKVPVYYSPYVQLQQFIPLKQYKENTRDTMQNDIRLFSIAAPYSFQGNVNVKFNTAEVYAASQDDSYIFGKDKSGVPSYESYGLVLHYDATITLSDKGFVCSKSGKDQPAEYKKIIDDSVAAKEWEFSRGFYLFEETIEYTKEDIAALVSAIIMQESSWNPDAVSECGAAGLMQFIPATARSRGLNVPEYEFEWCPSREETTCGTKVSSCNSCTIDKCDRILDERFIPQRSIPAGIDYIHFLINKYFVEEKYSGNRDEILKMVLVAYKEGEGALEKAIDNPDINKIDAKYIDIRNYLPERATEYVNNAICYYTYYGGTITSGDYYYYHDEKQNKFYPRSFSIEMKAEDYLPALNCVEKGVELYNYNNLACCGGVIWACRSGIEGIKGEQILSKSEKVNTKNAVSGNNCNKMLNPIDPAENPQIELPIKDLVCRNGFRIELRCDPGQYFSLDGQCTPCPTVSSCGEFADMIACDSCTTSNIQSCDSGIIFQNGVEVNVCNPGSTIEISICSSDQYKDSLGCHDCPQVSSCDEMSGNSINNAAECSQCKTMNGERCRLGGSYSQGQLQFVCQPV